MTTTVVRTCQISGCDRPDGVWLVTRYPNEIRRVCARCRDELTSLFGWSYFGVAPNAPL